MGNPNRNPKVIMIFAQDKNNVLGKGNDIPWRSPHDFRWFRTITIGQTVIMGRKTWESLPETVRPLINRDNYVISNNPGYVAAGAVVKTSLQNAIDDARLKDKHSTIFVIGGKSLLEEASKVAKKAYVTRIGVKTPVDETCVMAPELPEYTVEEINLLFNGDEIHPSAIVEVIRFI